MESVCEQQCSSLARDSQLDLGLDFDWFHCSSGCMFRLVVLLQDCPVFGSIHLPINSDQVPCPCWRNASTQHDAATTMFHGGDGVSRVMCTVSFLPHIAFCLYAKNFNFLIWPGHLPPHVCCIPHMACGKLHSFIWTMAFFLPLFHEGPICEVHDQ